LDDADVAVVLSFKSNILSRARHSELLKQGESGSGAGVLLSGMAYRYKINADGKRQVVGIICPGDIFGLEGLLKDRSDHGIATLTQCQIAWVLNARMREIVDQYAAVWLALWRLFIIDTSIYREWLLNIGTRSALARTAHLICELYVRAAQVGRANDGSFSWPMPQAFLGDALGLTTVHINRTFHRLRELGLIGPYSRTMKILDWDGLVEQGQFDPSYLLAGEQGGKFTAPRLFKEPGRAVGVPPGTR
jgi:CRP-like cAMP-binding protein